MPPRICPNCHKQAEGFLYSNELYGVVHCGCFYESDPKDVLFHSSEQDPPDVIEAREAERSLVDRCLRDLGKGWDEAVEGLRAAKGTGADNLVERAYAARLAELVALSYGPLDLKSLILTLRRTVLHER